MVPSNAFPLSAEARITECALHSSDKTDEAGLIKQSIPMLVKRILTIDDYGSTDGAVLTELCQRNVLVAECSFYERIGQRRFGSNNADAATCSRLSNGGLLIFFSLLHLLIDLS